jgi:uncharacterized Zn-binding protein involved in type VI secretion
MGNPIARVGDAVFCPADGHPFGWPVPVTGLIQVGAQSDYTNDRATATTNPNHKSTHAACAGPNTFYPSSGSPVLYVEDYAAARSGDQTTHCGGTGTILPLCSLDSYA